MINYGRWGKEWITVKSQPPISPEQRLVALGLTLPEAPAPAGLYLPARQSGSTLYVSGTVAAQAPASVPVIGKVGTDLTLDQARVAARLTGLAVLAAIRAQAGSLDAVAGILKVLGMVNCAPGFTRTPEVINGCSELFVEVFGDAGRHARSAIGVAELPFGMAVEIEMVVELA